MTGINTAHVTFNAEDYVNAMKLHALWSRRRLLVHLGVIAVALIVVATSRSSYWLEVLSSALLGGAVAAVVLYGVLRIFYLPWKARRMFAQQKSLHAGYDFQWTDDGLVVDGRNARSQTAWGDYLKRKENDRVALLYHSDLLFQMLPKRAFSEEQWASLRPYLDRVGQ